MVPLTSPTISINYTPGGKARKASLNYVPLEDWRELSRLRATQGRQEPRKE